ncbi:MAG: XdhC family protein [Planctomycetes bacterium]|nr:XdhC family protein [Planctomycetota bacterium]
MLHDVFARAAELIRSNRRFALVHLVKVKGSSPGKSGFKLLVTDNGETVGTIGGGDAERQMIAQALEAMREGRGRSVAYELSSRPGNLVQSLCGGANEVFIEVFMEKPCLLLLGGGHVARAVAGLCAMLEYPYVVLDDRVDFAKATDFPSALDVVCARGGDYLTREDLPKFTHVIGLGYDAEFDLDGLVPALTQLGEGVRFGTIGSKPKFAKMGETASQRGISPQQWARVKCPVGMSIGAQTPAEIALAILAEVVASLPGRESHGWK